MIRTTVEDAPERLKELIDAALRGEEVVITAPGDDGEKIVHLTIASENVPIPRRQFGSARASVIKVAAMARSHSPRTSHAYSQG